jgi:hypothetical protein
MFYMIILLFSQDLHDYEYFVLDYKCAEYELRVLEKIMSTPSNGEEKLVYYPEIASINRKLLDCLFKKSEKEAYLNDEVTIKNIYIYYSKLVHSEHITQTVYTTYHMQVMNAYIGLIKTRKNLMHRTDGSIIIENTFISKILKRDGKNKEEEMDNFYPKTDEVNIKTMEKRVNSYLQTDMVS